MKTTKHTSLLLTFTATCLIILTATVHAKGKSVNVSNNANSGPGSFRAAVGEANGNANIKKIDFKKNLDPILIESPVNYSGAQSLKIEGRGATITPTGGDEGVFDLFVSDGGADLDLKDFALGSGRIGINIIVPAVATGDISVKLSNMTVIDNGLFGLLIDDANVNDEFGVGSAAGIDVTIDSSTISDNGLAEPDVDGVLLIEMGAGSILATIKKSEINGNGGDGLELCEAGAGDAVLDASKSTFDGNGIGIDDQDAIDIDEKEEGDVLVRMVDVTGFANVAVTAPDEGFDFDEAGDGDLLVILEKVEVSGTDDEGVKCTEEGNGDLVAKFTSIVILDTIDKEGIQLEEFGDGDLDVKIVKAKIDNTLDDDGIQLDESGDGNLKARIVNSEITNSDKFGLKVEHADAGNGNLQLQKVTFGGNGDGPYEATDVTVKVKP